MTNELQCPYCQRTVEVGHMDWASLVCLNCHKDVHLDDWGPVFDPEKGATLIDNLEALFPANPKGAALHCCVVLIGLTPNNDVARMLLEYSIVAVAKFERETAKWLN